MGGGNHTKNVNRRATSVFDASVQLCAEINNANHGRVKLKFSVMGNWGVSAGNNLRLTGYGDGLNGGINGKYFVDKVTHKYTKSGGFVTSFECSGNTKGGAYYGKATNRNPIGIEVCSTNDTGKMTVANDSHWRFTDKVVSNLVELVKYLMAEYGIDAAHVIRHYDVNGKPCPGIIGWNEDTGSAAKWAAFKARLGAATHGGQTGGSTNTGTATGNTALTYKVGDIVQFAGGKHYANAQAASGTTVKPGQAKVTAVATAGKHPYHLVHTDGTSTVYGWVDAAAITGKASATPAAKTYTVKAGDSLWRIAAQQLGNGARYKEIKTLNGLKNNTIHAGQVLKLPN